MSTDAAQGTTRVVVVGDVHGDFDAGDEAAIDFLQPDVTLFVGDIGEEDVELVERIASFAHRHPRPVAVELGNHDAWHSLTARGRTNFQRLDPCAAVAMGSSCVTPALQQQMDALGPAHVGYADLQIPAHRLSIVGGRPFSKGGKSWKDMQPFYRELYGIGSLEESGQRVGDVIAAQPVDHAVVVLAHNGRTGLGRRRFDICGVDWKIDAGDHGDSDLSLALDEAAGQGRSVAACVFGHMHHRCRGDGTLRRRIAVTDDGVVHLNAAVVPRHMVEPRFGVVRHFVLLELSDGHAVAAADLWVASDSASPRILSTEPLLRTLSTEPFVREFLDVQTGRWVRV